MLRYIRARSRNFPLLSDNVLEQLAEAATAIDDTWGDRRATLNECLTRITEKARRLLRLRYVKALSPAEIAHKLQYKISSVNVNLTRIRKALRECTENKLSRMET